MPIARKSPVLLCHESCIMIESYVRITIKELELEVADWLLTGADHWQAQTSVDNLNMLNRRLNLFSCNLHMNPA